ncbi:hypothetical protein HSRCO_2844 [Halanaeroarchaeum sp. HSR-CO]|nr:hypothetical protein HSRCO_2844 [Halanaeroarchaeum sp. HSR-CO]
MAESHQSPIRTSEQRDDKAVHSITGHGTSSVAVDLDGWCPRERTDSEMTRADSLPSPGNLVHLFPDFYPHGNRPVWYNRYSI